MSFAILPSLLAADFGYLAEAARKAEAAGGDALHLDIMDGHFVPNLSMGADVVAMAKRTVHIPLSVHLMLSHPHKYIERFVEAGADRLLIHVEAECDVAATLESIRKLGVIAGLTLNPDTPADAVYPLLDAADEFLIMTVYPGFGGQSFMPDMLVKISALRQRLVKTGRSADILVDGGIDIDTASLCAKAGANHFVAGSALYKSVNMSAAICQLRASVQQATAVGI